MYEVILEQGAPAFETVLRHVKDHPDEPCVVHCTGGFASLSYSMLFLNISPTSLVSSWKG